MCPVTTVTRPPKAVDVSRPQWVRTHNWMTHCLLQAKKALSLLSLTLTDSSSSSPTASSSSFCTYLHLSVFQVNKSHLVFSQTVLSSEPRRGVGVYCWLASRLIFISILPFCLAVKAVNLHYHFVVISIHEGPGQVPRSDWHSWISQMPLENLQKNCYLSFVQHFNLKWGVATADGL